MYDQPDIIIIGGGSSGCALAGRLAERGDLTIMLIEAGKAAPDRNTHIPALVAKLVMNPAYDWMYPTEPDASTNGQPGFWPAGRILGGGSAINGMMYIRGHAEDYDNWEKAGATGWSYADCLPFFRRMESNPRGGPFHGNDGPLHISESRLDYPLTDIWMQSAVHAGIARNADLNGDGYNAIGVDRVQASQRNGNRWSAADAYVRGKNYNGRLKICDQTIVRKILIEHGAATGVEIIANDGTVRTIYAKQGVILAAGAIASPKLLMLSGIGPADHLQATGITPIIDSPGVGANLQDHVGANVAWRVRGRTINSDLRGLRPAKAVLDYLFRRRGMITAAISNAQAMVQIPEKRAAASLQLAFSPFSFDILPNGERVMPKDPMISMLVCALHPQARGSIRLRSSDPMASPVITHQLLGGSEDVDLLMTGVSLARNIMAQRPMADHVIAEAKPGPNIEGDALKQWIRQQAISCFHPVGSCRMGSDDKAVVSPDLQVKGLNRLWVADCSIMPELVSANTNATAIMIGEKASDHIGKALNHG
ncbi:MAG: glucose-methanol-choline oxidoreductase [Sphingobium sp.]|nr:glucose-methanol-choline oxidoreductase [Sphingobium sp.]